MTPYMIGYFLRQKAIHPSVAMETAARDAAEVRRVKSEMYTLSHIQNVHSLEAYCETHTHSVEYTTTLTQKT